ncbi:uncharacterized protein SCHCODRAFT_02754047 [Schizophyllum commune H4-8]|uniref:Uncharacterized protein n=1 Tax=Schizophyllum commune (strain H4-8 / FGSC 9210) TaxID=578458 RepID=D8QMC3_SCHCM|nr:uncharacterized protein SCHCODRAFT_02754047 [Schizophyllum commune H4-8]KAI5836615.1 hypothetical protein SCHCODRAFT_02754047 [Schizophyllum commune H4-8]
MDALDILTLAKNILDLGEGIREVTVTAEFVARVAILRSVFVKKRTVKDSDVKAYWEEVDNRLADIRKDKTSSDISRIIYRSLRVDIDFYGNGGKDINVAAMPSAPSSMFE